MSPSGTSSRLNFRNAPVSRVVVRFVTTTASPSAPTRTTTVGIGVSTTGARPNTTRRSSARTARFVTASVSSNENRSCSGGDNKLFAGASDPVSAGSRTENLVSFGANNPSAACTRALSPPLSDVARNTSFKNGSGCPFHAAAPTMAAPPPASANTTATGQPHSGTRVNRNAAIVPSNTTSTAPR